MAPDLLTSQANERKREHAMTDYDATRAVTRGAELLDTYRPGWESEVDLDTLDIASLDSCVLGQLYGDWGKANRAIPEIEWNAGSQMSYGFEAPQPDRQRHYKALNVAWTAEIERRLAVTA